MKRKRVGFTEAEAEEKIGQRIKTLVAFRGVPKGTTGKVIRMDQGALEGCLVAVQWDLPERVTIGGRAFAVQRSKPRMDWFSKDEYQQYLVEER